MTMTSFPMSVLNIVGNLRHQCPGSSNADKALVSTAIPVIDDDTTTVFRVDVDILERTLRDLWDDTSRVIVLQSLVWTNTFTL